MKSCVIWYHTYMVSRQHITSIKDIKSSYSPALIRKITTISYIYGVLRLIGSTDFFRGSNHELTDGFFFFTYFLREWLDATFPHLFSIDSKQFTIFNSIALVVAAYGLRTLQRWGLILYAVILVANSFDLVVTYNPNMIGFLIIAFFAVIFGWRNRMLLNASTEQLIEHAKEEKESQKQESTITKPIALRVVAIALIGWSVIVLLGVAIAAIFLSKGSTVDQLLISLDISISHILLLIAGLSIWRMKRRGLILLMLVLFFDIGNALLTKSFDLFAYRVLYIPSLIFALLYLKKLS